MKRIAIAALALAACADPVPAWVADGSGATVSGELRGVGRVDGIRNPALRRSTADARARAEVARQLDQLMTLLVPQVGPDRSDDGADVPHPDASRRRAIQAMLNGVTVRERHLGPDGAEHSLTALSREQVLHWFASQPEVPADVRRRIAERLPAAWDDLARR